jgi:hypothetical protein
MSFHLGRWRTPGAKRILCSCAQLSLLACGVVADGARSRDAGSARRPFERPVYRGFGLDRNGARIAWSALDRLPCSRLASTEATRLERVSLRAAAISFNAFQKRSSREA